MQTKTQQQLINLPVPRDVSWYETTKQEFVERVSVLPGVVSIYLGGSVRNPGISDHDFVVCLENKAFDFRLSDFEDGFSDDLKAAIGGGSVLRVPRSRFTDVKIIDDFDLTHVWGEMFKFREYDSKWFALCRAMDWLPERRATLQRLLDSDEVDVLWGLQVLKSLTVTLRNASRVTENKLQLAFIDEVFALRDTWWNERQGDLINVLEAGVVQAGVAIAELGNFLQNKQWLEHGNDILPRQFVVPDGFHFTKGNLPDSFLYFYALQARHDSWLGAQLRKALAVPDGSDILGRYVENELLATVDARMEYLAALADWFRSNGLRRGLLKYGWFV